MDGKYALEGGLAKGGSKWVANGSVSLQVVSRRYIKLFPNGSVLLARSINLRICDLGHTATVFGATGFLGRYIVSRLGMFKTARRRYFRLTVLCS